MVLSKEEHAGRMSYPGELMTETFATSFTQARSPRRGRDPHIARRLRLMFTQIAPLAAIVLFWAIIFVAAFFFSRRALNAPREDAHEEIHTEVHESTSAGVDDQVTSKSGH